MEKETKIMIAEVRTKNRNLPVKTGTPEKIRDFFIALDEKKPGLYVLRYDREVVTLDEFEKLADLKAIDVAVKFDFGIKKSNDSSELNEDEDSAEEKSDDDGGVDDGIPSERWKTIL
jgi:hypothetical protein